MCNSTPSAVFRPETLAAFDELRIAAANHMGWDPDKTTMAISRPSPIEDHPDDSQISNFKSQIRVADPDALAEYLGDTEAFDI